MLWPDRTVTKLAAGPTLVLTSHLNSDILDMLRLYDPAVRVLRKRFAFSNGVLLFGPIAVTPEIAQEAGLAESTVIAFRAGIALQRHRSRRPAAAKWTDAERLLHGLAVRLHGAIHDRRPAIETKLGVDVYSETELAVDDLTELLESVLGERPTPIHEDDMPADSYILITEREPSLLISYYPPRLSRAPSNLPPPALGDLRHRDLHHWSFTTTVKLPTVDRDTCLAVGQTALGLSQTVSGVAVDMWGFPLERSADLLRAIAP